MALTSSARVDLDADQFAAHPPKVGADFDMSKRTQQFPRRTFLMATSLVIATLSLPPMQGGLADDVQVGGRTDTRIERLLQAKRLMDGRRDYTDYCASCHGEEGEGAGGIAAFAEGAGDVLRIVDAISGGHEDKIASAWQPELDKERAAGVAEYVQQTFLSPSEQLDRSAGQAIYARTCSVCHGEKGDGASWAHRSLSPPPIDFTSARAREMSRHQMIVAAGYGVDGTAMMPFSTQLSPAEIAAVVDYIRVEFVNPENAVEPGATSHADHVGHAHGDAMPIGGDMGASFPEALVGDYQRGKAFYEENCAECHGINGAGDGRRAYFIRPKPRDFTSDRSRAELNRPHLFGAIANGVVGREMPAWSKVIDHQQIADVAEYVFATFIRPSTESTPNNGSSAPSWQPASDNGSAKKN